MEWILILEKAIGQDQQDHRDKAAFGRGTSRHRRKKSHQSCKSGQKKLIKIESIPHPFDIRDSL